jgi:DnaJ homolog subfamily C member 9
MHLIEEAFGEGCNLYTDVLKCEKDADKASLRKAYYRTALQYHPDKNPGDENAAANFQAVTAAYQILLDPDMRAAYDESEEIPADGPDDDGDDNGAHNQWKEFFDRIFGKVTVGDIEAFAAKYKCSDEEKRDVLKEYTARKGNLVKMLEFVMLSEARDAQRWVEDYLQPAIEAKEISSLYVDTMEKSLKKLQKKVEQQDAAAAAKEGEDNDDDDDDIDPEDDKDEEDDDETEIEEEETPPAQRKRRRNQSTEKRSSGKQSPKKPKPSKSKSKENNMSDLVAQIQNRRGTAANAIANLGARYGVSMEDDEDPLNDKDFANTQAKLHTKATKGAKPRSSKKS